MLRDAGVTSGLMTFTRTADMRYRGQGYEVDVHLPDGPWSAGTATAIQQCFDEVYRDLYGRLTPDVPIEFVTLRLVASGPRPEFPITPKPPGETAEDAAKKGMRHVYFAELESYVDVPVFDRYLLPAQSTFTGPAIVEERESTAVIGPDASCRIDEFGNLIVDLEYRPTASVSRGK
jgi:N-methylhydantoinase A